jgi:hypothetical protein
MVYGKCGGFVVLFRTEISADSQRTVPRFSCFFFSCAAISHLVFFREGQISLLEN